MNEIEYAITNLEEFLEADIGQGDLHMCSAEAALIALREQQAREKGCDYCGLIYKLDGASYGTDSVIIENRFCPMCGRRLEVEP
jgi:hypothetical protein